LLSFLPKAAFAHNTDYRAHKFKTSHHLLLTIFAHLVRAESANALLEELNDLDSAGRERNLRQMLGFDQLEGGEPLTLNQSSFSRANATRTWRLWRYSFHRLLELAKKHCHPRQLEGLGQIVAVDGSLFDCLPQMVWATYRSDTNKIKGHFFFDPEGLPEKLVLTTGKGSEREVLSTHFRRGVTYLMDRGYNDYELFRFLPKEQAHFVTRKLRNATVQILEDLPIAPAQANWGILKDQRVRLGKEGNTVELRLVTYQDNRKLEQPREWQFITDRLDLTPRQVVELYQYRWQIERFFAWIKRHMQYGHWYSHCENGVLIQLYAGLSCFVLLKLYLTLGAKPEFKACFC
jgi:hypothetical protein